MNKDKNMGDTPNENTVQKFEDLLQSPKCLNISDFERYVEAYLERKNDKNLAVRELDTVIAALQSHILSLALYFKQRHLLRMQASVTPPESVEYYTKQEVAIKYRVSVRTINNWILDGLEAIEIGGVKRISDAALSSFVKSKRSKKFAWRSIARW